QADQLDDPVGQARARAQVDVHRLSQGRGRKDQAGESGQRGQARGSAPLFRRQLANRSEKLAHQARSPAVGAATTSPSPSSSSCSRPSQDTRTSRREGSSTRVSTMARRRSVFVGAPKRAISSGPQRRMATANRPSNPKVNASANTARAKSARFISASAN